jgi:AcrR family transcriptional regulator
MATGTRSAHPTRQARRRAATYDEIVHAGRTLIAHRQELTVRGVATQMGASPAGLYRYIAHLDELRDLVAASVDESLADDVLADLTHFPEDAAIVRWLAGWTSLRRWALARPEEFRLLVARPRSEGLALRELSDACLGQLLHAMWLQHDIPLPPVPPSVLDELAELGPRGDADVWPPALLWLHARICGSLHGIIALEVTGYVEPGLVSTAGLYRTTMIDWLARLGQASGLDQLLPILDAELAR